jgi:molybdopterin-guanine dinucleotide biosynthesis protein A
MRPGSSADLSGIVLAGGAARRLSGADKPGLDVGGRPLLSRALDALAGAPVVVVGPERPGFPGVAWTREVPSGSGPVAALAAGLDAVRPRPGELLAVFAGDLAGVRPSTVDKLLGALADDADGAVLVDGTGHRQWLVGIWRGAPLRAAMPDEPAGASLRGVLGALRVREVPADAGEAADVDTPEDLARHRDEQC